MDQILYVVKWLIVIQLSISIALIIVFYLTCLWLNLYRRLKNRSMHKISEQLDGLIHHQATLSPQMILYFRKHLSALLACLDQLDKTLPNTPAWKRVKKQLSNQVLGPQAHKLACSRSWLKQYLAIDCFRYQINPNDEKLLARLVQSETLLVSLNAAKLIFQYPTIHSVNALINALSQGRHIQQSFFAETLSINSSSAKRVIVPALINRLNIEDDPYIKSFCYRILIHFPATKTRPDVIDEDMANSNLALKIAAIHYLVKAHPKIAEAKLPALLDDKQFEVRAVVAASIGQLHHQSLVPSLTNLLSDDVWWVRINAALSLSKLGQKGLSALKAQSKKDDPFAYDTAQQVLTTLHHFKQ